MVPDPPEIKEEMLKKYPPKVAQKAGEADRHKQGRGGGAGAGDPRQHKDDTGHPHHERLRLRGLQGRRARAYAGHPPDHPRARSAAAFIAGSPGATRRGRRRPSDANFMTYAMSTDMQEEEIIFGGEKKLRKAIEEAIELFHPKAIGIFSTCPVGLIGDDVHAVCRGTWRKNTRTSTYSASVARAIRA